MPIIKSFKTKFSAGGSKKDHKAKPLPPRLTFTEQAQPDDYIIKSFDDLFSKTVRVWRGGSWNDNVKNGATGALFESSHHVPGEGAKSRAAFKDGKFGFCLEWIDFSHEGLVHRVRCMNEFCVKSQQCTDHPKTVYKDGPNRIYDLMNRGDKIIYGMIKDTGAPEVLEGRSNLYGATPGISTSGSIYNSRTTANNSAPGNAVLDAKARRNPNDTKKKGRTGYIKALGSIDE